MTISKLLVANRGEIAVRVFATCRRLGIATVAVVAPDDRESFHARVADDVVQIAGYLRSEEHIRAAKQAGAEAIHPGYGFLAENAEFAEAVIEAGITWIGPPPDAIRKLGDKTQARHIALAVGAPLTPGTADPVSGVDEVVAFADEYGLPIAIKAAFGGGG
ncbi:MAG: acetyl-CoA/propionyl-CoA carboxylase, biotin carboxylase, biotin carboxyl carrier protein, partial [Gaiellaceae bacterium]|nr:acetyl-CoA/propionyl-CoA carboxylase, biotin carboxylase, biotin carboxyl carrier protein [Gaiellaceae bacterium]